MRRGHPNVGGWRGENPRHFRPRGGRLPHFRPPRPFGPSEPPRFPPPGPRTYRGSNPYNVQHPDDMGLSGHRGRNPYVINNLTRSQERGHHNRDKQMFIPQIRQNDDHGSSYSESNYYKNQNQCRINNLGDIDHRINASQQRDFSQRSVPHWINPPFESNMQHFDDRRSPHKASRHQIGEAPLPDYSGHRPPSSDHYAATPGPNNNNTPYTRSVDDTVDIVRKRLMNRELNLQTEPSADHQAIMDEDLRKNTNESYQDVPPPQPEKRKPHRQKQNIKLNCDKMKNKIVHQLFKMDKTKIHKLMDNPNSSNKFEYAISTLITESQNSLNRHLRSEAERSLCSSSSDFIQNDNNTIYEDTFMKQMQGILDPQDTILLEDIKPLVMAELSKVLQLDGTQFEAIEDQGIFLGEDQFNLPYHNEIYNHETYPQDAFYEQEHMAIPDNTEIITGDLDERNYVYEQQTSFESKPLFKRRPEAVRSLEPSEERRSTESRQSRSNENSKSFEDTFRGNEDTFRGNEDTFRGNEDTFRGNEDTFRGNQDTFRGNENTFRGNDEQIPLFDPNMEQFSEEEDPFDELDRQYHVAVDHNYIENDIASPSPPQQTYSSIRNISPPSFKGNRSVPECRSVSEPQNSLIQSKPTVDIKKEIDIQLQNIAQSPLKILSGSKERDAKAKTVSEQCLKPPKEIIVKEKQCDENVKQEEPVKIKSEKLLEKIDNSTNKKSTDDLNSRKRSIDQKPSHRKEKRKKSSNSECQDIANTILTTIFTDVNSKEKPKDNKKVESSDKAYSDKYVKRKDSQRKSKDVETPKLDESKKQNANSSSHSIVSSRNRTNSVSSKTDSKLDTKVKLKTINIFDDKPKKPSVQHQAHRNTAVTITPLAVSKSPDENKPKPVVAVSTPLCRKLAKRHVGTQVVKKYRHSHCQTEKCKPIVKGTQTDPVLFERSKPLSSKPLERMKEIDLEIQLLLQEKFKLYNSLEFKTKLADSTNSAASLGMAVFAVPTEEEQNLDNEDGLSEDAIVDDFTSIPVEELEQIAMETVDVDLYSSTKAKKKDQRQKVLEQTRKNSESPTTKQKKKAKTPNISLIEQIITDDRPIEDIISLDALESTPVKSKKKTQKSAPKKKATNKKGKATKASLKVYYDIRECSVVLHRTDISKYLYKSEHNSNGMSRESLEQERNITPNLEVHIAKPISESNITFEDAILISEESQEELPAKHEPLLPSEIVEEVVNDLQFDMLDVSEDIVIGDNSGHTDKDEQRVAVSEEIILDNSQSSMEDVAAEPIPDNECKTYDYSTDETLKRDSITVTGNADAVLAVECIENDFIAACLDGNVYHFSGDGQLLNTLRGSNLAVTCLTIVKEKYGTTVYTGSLDSRIRYYDLDTGLEKGPECNVLSPIQTMDRAWDTVFVGTRTGFVLQFECKNNMLIPVSTVKFSEQSILALRAMKEGPRKVLLVAARSENVTIKDAQTGLLLRTLAGPKMTVYTLLFEDGKVYCGTSSHHIHVFDYASGSHAGAHLGGKGAVCLRATGGLVFAGCYDGCVYVFREASPRPLAVLRGPSLMLLSLSIAGTKIIAGYKDRSLYIWKIPLPILQEMIL